MAKRILGLGQTAQELLLGVYRAQFQGHGVAAYGGSREHNEARKALEKRGLVFLRKPRKVFLVELTGAGRSAVVRIAPLHFPLLALVCVLTCLGCGDEFVGIEPETDPRVIVLVYGLYEPPPEDVCVEQPRPARHEPDAGRSR